MILKHDEYYDLWNQYFSKFCAWNLIQPGGDADYQEYLKREHMLEDYLDIFRKCDTRSFRRVPHPTISNWDSVAHPFDQQIKSPNVYSIKYILIAEAAPAPNKQGKRNYLYDPAYPGGPYIDAPLGAFGINNSPNPLVDLATLGVLILDLFPFSIDFTKLRNKLNKKGVTMDFFNNPINIYSIVSRINYLLPSRVNISLNTQSPNAAFIAPPATSHFVAHNILSPKNYGSLINSGLNFRIGENTFNFVVNRSNFLFDLLHSKTHTYIVNYNYKPQYVLKLKNGKNTKKGTNGNLNKSPIYQCCGYDGAGNPNSLFIKNALLI